MKYNLVRKNALSQALSLSKRKFENVYVAESGIYPYGEELKELKRIMLTEPSCICNLNEVIVALRCVKDDLIEVELLEFPEGIKIGVRELIYNPRIK